MNCLQFVVVDVKIHQCGESSQEVDVTKEVLTQGKYLLREGEERGRGRGGGVWVKKMKMW